MKISLYMHGGSGNHGCEALVRTVSAMCSPIGEVTVYSKRPHEDCHYIGTETVRFVECGTPPPKTSLAGLWSRVRSKAFGDNFAFVKPAFAPLLRSADASTVAVSIGGDNYCYDGVPAVLAILNQELNKRGAKTVLFGCSVEPELLEQPEIVADLSRYALITARESITYEAMQKAGIATEILLAPDPAFTLPAELLPLPDGFAENNTVGINISPMVLEYAAGKQVLFDAYCRLIEYILKETEMHIALIPHVVWQTTNDLKPIEKLFLKYADSGRVVKIEDNNATVLKGYIARCRFFVGARTHSTIAAYSSCVPTLTVGYSVKSRGIARDLFGTEEHFVKSVDHIQQDTDLVKEFQWLMAQEDTVRHHLTERMPAYIQSAFKQAERIQALCK